MQSFCRQVEPYVSAWQRVATGTYRFRLLTCLGGILMGQAATVEVQLAVATERCFKIEIQQATCEACQ